MRQLQVRRLLLSAAYASRRRLAFGLASEIWRKRAWAGLIAIALLVAASIGSLVAGFEIAYRDLPGNGLLKKIDRKVRYVATGGPERIDNGEINTALLRLVADVGIVDVEGENLGSWFSQRGGGLTSFGSEVLLLPYDGQIRAARSGRDIWETGLRVPDNNREAYRSLINDPAFDNYLIAAEQLRYNDILHYQSDVGRGLIASYTEFHPEELCFTNTLAKLDVPATAQSVSDIQADAQDWKILYRSRPCLPLKDRDFAIEGHIAGGRLAFVAPSTVLMTMGDFHFDGMRPSGNSIAQDPDADYGKLLAIDVITGSARTISTGHRNAQGITIDANGDVFMVEHGPQGGDELNRVREGENYGWPLESYGIAYSNNQLPEAASFGRHGSFAAPELAWVPSVGISGLTTIDGFHEAWDGDLLASSLTGQSLFRIRFEHGKFAYSEPIAMKTRIRYVHQHSTGEIVLWTDNGELIFLTAEDFRSEEEPLRTYVAASHLDPRAEEQLVSAITHCAECHSFVAGDDRKAPSLARVHGAAIAGTGYAMYSEALTGLGGRWTSRTLGRYLSDPQAFAPGTNMPPLPSHDEELIHNIVGYLEFVEARL